MLMSGAFLTAKTEMTPLQSLFVQVWLHLYLDLVYLYDVYCALCAEILCEPKPE